MRKLSLTLALIFALALAVGAAAEGILPVLQTPPPEIIETLSFHRAMNYSSTPSAGTTGDGGYYYEYSSVNYATYLDFGRALAQEGFTLAQIEVADDGTGVVNATCTKDTASLTVTYNADTRLLKVTYAPRVLAEEVDSENPYVIDETQASILPELAQVISLHAVTGISYSDVKYNSDQGGYIYYYSSVPYAAYARFSAKLGEAGFSLVSTDKTEDGYDRAVVTDGEVELTIDYHQENKYARVIYPPYAHARGRALFDDYDVVSDGDTIEVMENVKVTFNGWEYVDQYYSSYDGTVYSSEDGTRIALIHLDVDFYRPETWYVYDLLKGYSVYSGRMPVDGYNFGQYEYEPDSSYLNYVYSSRNDLSGKAQFSAAIAIRLTEEQAANIGDVSVTFYSTDYTTPYVYRLQAQ